MNRKPQPLYSPGLQKLCPVCGEVSYSTAGVHPQCAMDQADAKRMKGVKPRSKSSKKMTSHAGVKPWQKPCPKCRVFLHVRKKTCECGYSFSNTCT